MCSRARPGTTALLVLSTAVVMTLSPHEVAARQTADQPTADELRARLDALRPQRAAAREAAAARETRDITLLRSAAATVATVDTIHVGMMTIITPVDQAETARELFAEVWDESFSHIQSSRELERARFAFQWSEQRVPIHIDENPRPIELSSRWIRRANVKGTIGQSIAATINYDLSTHSTLVGRWVGGNPLLPPTYARVYRMVATTQSASTRACFDGVIAECISGLRLTMPPSPRWDAELSDEGRLEVLTRFEEIRRQHLTSWYTVDERRSMVVRAAARRPTREGRDLWSQCVDGGESAACDDFLLRWGIDKAPMSGSVRESFMAYAIEQGGPGAWERLLDDPDKTALEALEHASGQSIEDLAAGWRERVLSYRPVTFASLFPRSGLAILWFVFFSALAMRSTRWRLG